LAKRHITKKGGEKPMNKTKSRNLSKERLGFAIEQFKKHDIEYCLKNEQSGHFHCRKKSDDTLIQFWAGTGKIMGYGNLCGIHNLIGLLTESF